jgi:hypothetical protein
MPGQLKFGVPAALIRPAVRRAPPPATHRTLPPFANKILPTTIVLPSCAQGAATGRARDTPVDRHYTQLRAGRSLRSRTRRHRRPLFCPATRRLPLSAITLPGHVQDATVGRHAADLGGRGKKLE